MKKILVIMLVIAVAAAFILANEARCRRAENLYDAFSKMEVVKVHVSDITDSTEGKKAQCKPLKALLENALATRITINFKLASKEEADIVVLCDITEYLWSESDPIDMITGVAGILLDAMSKENYARMKAYFTVTDPKKNKVLWKDSLKATVTSKEMTEPDSVYTLNERMVEVFIRDCFSKPHARS